MKKLIFTLTAICFATCDASFMASADFLYWYARETGLYYAIKVTGENVVPEASIEEIPFVQRLVSTPVRYETFHPGWKPGVRVGLGYQNPCSNLDVRGYWTYFHTNDHRHQEGEPFCIVPNPGQYGFLNPWINPALTPPVSQAQADGGFPYFQGITFWQIGADWEFTCNQLDIEIGNNLRLGTCFSIRPYAGVRGAWTKTHFKTRSECYMQIFQIEDLEANFHDRFLDRFRGAGLLAGIECTFDFTPYLSFYGKVNTALLWGKYDGKNQQVYSGSGDVNPEENVLVLEYAAHPCYDYQGMQPVLDLGLGLNWEQTICECYQAVLQIGWEHHEWFNHTHRSKLLGRATGINCDFEVPYTLRDFFTGAAEEVHDIGFGGLVIKAQLSY